MTHHLIHLLSRHSAKARLAEELVQTHETVGAKAETELLRTVPEGIGQAFRQLRVAGGIGWCQNRSVRCATRAGVVWG